MPRRSVLLFSFATCLLMASSTSAIGLNGATDVTGKRFKLTMKSKVQYTGVIKQLSEKSVFLADVSSTGEAERGVPFLSNRPYVNRKFKNVGLLEEKNWNPEWLFLYMKLNRRTLLKQTPRKTIRQQKRTS